MPVWGIFCGSIGKHMRNIVFLDWVLLTLVFAQQKDLVLVAGSEFYSGILKVSFDLCFISCGGFEQALRITGMQVDR